MVVLPCEEELRPGRSTLLVVCPLHLVEHEHLAPVRRHLDGAAEDRRVLVDPLLAREQPDPIRADHRAEPAMRLLREHPQRAGVDASPVLGEERECVVGLARVRRAEVRDRPSAARAAAAGAGSRSGPRPGSRPHGGRRRWRGRGGSRATGASAVGNGVTAASGNRSRASSRRSSGGGCQARATSGAECPPPTGSVVRQTFR